MMSLCPTDSCTTGHALLGAAAGLLPSDIGYYVVIGFGLYELLHAKPAKALNAFGEFGLGLGAAYLVKAATA